MPATFRLLSYLGPFMLPTERIRRVIHDVFREMGATDSEPITETILIRGGYYCGRRFLCDGFEAIWFVEENQIKFYGRDGAVARITKADTQEADVRRRVA